MIVKPLDQASDAVLRVVHQPNNFPLTAVIVVGFNAARTMERCLQSLIEFSGPAEARNIVYVDNASIDGSAERVSRLYPGVTVIRSEQNLGYAGGANLGWREAARRWPGTRYVALVNHDVFARPGWLDALVEFLQGHPAAAVAQPLILLAGTGNINTAGNRCHYLGFTWMEGFNQPDRGQYSAPRAIDAASGAALVVRADFIGRHGLFEEDLFMYFEDVELSWKARRMGTEVCLVPQAVVEHQFHLRAPFTPAYYYLQRNRWVLLLTHFDWKTLALLAPALALAELGQMVFAARHGVLRHWAGAMWYFANPAAWRGLRRRRQQARARRVLQDRQFLQSAAARVDFSIGGWLLKYLGNPMLEAWWRIVRRWL